MKKVVICDNHAYHITDEDFRKLKVLSPGSARLARKSDAETPTHFVCDSCGQIYPLKLRSLHSCSGQ